MKVRWDAVVADDSFWSESARTGSPPPLDGGPVCVQVWLFGALADVVKERPVELRFPGPARVADVFAELDRRYGAGLTAQITCSDGTKARTCRVFVNGELAPDVEAPISGGKSPAQVELILLNALEGG